MLFRSIGENIGTRYRKLLGTTGFVNVVLSYHHLSALEKSDVFKVDRQQPRTTGY
jgi:hypothetical protein